MKPALIGMAFLAAVLVTLYVLFERPNDSVQEAPAPATTQPAADQSFKL